MKIWKIAFAVIMLTTLAHPPVLAQDPEMANTEMPNVLRTLDPESTDDRNVLGYYIFEAFFDIAFMMIGDPDAFEWTLLRPLGIEPNTPAAKAIEDACTRKRRHRESLGILDMRSYRNQENFLRAQDNYLRKEVRETQAIYRSMMARLNAAGFETSTFWDFLYSEVAPSTALVSSDPDAQTEQKMFAIVRAEFVVDLPVPRTPITN